MKDTTHSPKGAPASAGSLWKMRETCAAPDKFLRYKRPWKLERIEGEKVHLTRTVEHEGLKIQWIDCTIAELRENFDEANT